MTEKLSTFMICENPPIEILATTFLYWSIMKKLMLKKSTDKNKIVTIQVR